MNTVIVIIRENRHQPMRKHGNNDEHTEDENLYIILKDRLRFNVNATSVKQRNER